MTEDAIFGTGTGNDEVIAADHARLEAAKTIAVDVREETTDTQVLAVKRTGTGSQEATKETVSRAAKSFVARRVEGCVVREQCRDEHDAIYVLLSCERRSALERVLQEQATKIAGALQPGTALLVVPGTDEAGYVTQLGEYTANLMRTALSNALAATGQGASVLPSSAWRPSDLHEVARTAGATHLVRIEHMRLDVTRVRISTYVQEEATDRPVPHTAVAAEVDLDEGQVGLLSVVGPLLPQKQTEALMNASGTYPVPLRISRTDLNEGDRVQIEVTVPRASYVYIYDIYEDGRAALLLPNPFTRENRYEPGAEIVLPNASWRRAGAELRACPLGRQSLTREVVKVIASPVSLDLPGTRASNNVFTMVASGEADGWVAAITRKLDELRQAGIPIGTADMSYFVHATKQPAAGCVTR